jgi:ABC-type proline/glycine betaine transport system permease subunit
MTRLVVWSVSLLIESVGPCLQGVWRLGLNFIILVFSVSKHAKIILEVGEVYATVPSGALVVLCLP